MKSLIPLFILLAGALLPHFSFGQGRVPMSRSAFNNRRFYDYRGRLDPNSIRLQVLQLPTNLRLMYERTVAKKVAVGASFSYQHGGKEAGSTKAELHGKIFLSHIAPVGLYFMGTVGQWSVQNHVFKYRMTDTEGGKKIEYDPTRPYVLEKKGSFSALAGGVAVGFQNASGPGKQFLIDFSVGYQFSAIPSKFKTTYTENELVYGKLDVNKGMTGPLSPIAARFGIGFLF
jgi:hypothetical protein